MFCVFCINDEIEEKNINDLRYVKLLRDAALEGWN